MTLPPLCLDCDEPCRIMLVCDPCAQVRRATDGEKWFTRLIRDTEKRFPEANITDRRVKKDRKMSESQLKKAQRQATVRTSWHDDTEYDEQEVQAL